MNGNVEKIINKKDASEKTEFSQYRLQSITELMEKHHTLNITLTFIEFIDEGVVLNIIIAKDNDEQKVFTVSKPLIQSLKNAMNANLSLPVSAKILKVASETSGQIYYDIV